MSAFFAVGLDTHPENQIAVDEGSDFFNMVNEITKVRVGQGALSLLVVELLLLEKEEEDEKEGKKKTKW